MAGYMKKLNGHIYDGANTAATALENGVFVEITANGVKAVAAAKDTVLRVVEKTFLWNMPAVILDVVSVGEDEVFFTENEWDINDNEDYDTAKYSCKVGDYVKMHRPTIGEQLVMTVASDLSTALAVGDKVTPTVAGTIAKATAAAQA